jgi:hypothetical protein
MKLRIGDSLEPIDDLFRRLQKHYPQHLGTITKLRNSVDQLLTRYKDHLWHHSRKANPRHLERAQQELDTLAELLTRVEKLELMLMLSGENRRD